MSILDDARRLADKSPLTYIHYTAGVECLYCEQEGDHAPDCPWLSMPRIVATLEAAETVARAYEQETAATGLHLLGSPLLAAVDALDKALGG